LVISLRIIHTDVQKPLPRRSQNEFTGLLSSWCLWLFFLWYGLAAFVSALNTDVFKKIGGALALGFVLFNLLAM
jgi:uncharacterized membrane protein (DUF485 family)